MWDTRDRNISLWQHTAACEYWCSDCIHDVFTDEELRANIPDVTPIPIYSWEDGEIGLNAYCGKCHERFFSAD